MEESFASTGCCTLSNVVGQSSRTGQIHTARSRGQVSRGKETFELCGCRGEAGSRTKRISAALWSAKSAQRVLSPQGQSRGEKKVSGSVVVAGETSSRTRRNSVFFGKQRPREECWLRVEVWHGGRRQQAIQAAALTTACTRRGYRRLKSAVTRAFRVSRSKGSSTHSPRG